MSREILTMATLNKLPNGEEAVTEFDRLIRVCATDCAQRQDIKRPRKVLMQLAFEPNGDDVIVNVAVKHVLPQRETSLVTGGVDRSGKLTFNPASPDEPDQKTLDEQSE